MWDDAPIKTTVWYWPAHNSIHTNEGGWGSFYKELGMIYLGRL